MPDKAVSFLAKLKNESKRQGIQLHQLLNMFLQEEFIRRLSRSKYSKKLILKGGFLLYSISDFKTRPTVDSDYLLNDYSNDIDAVRTLVKEVISLSDQDEFVKIDIRNLKQINEFKEYQGVRVNLVGYIGNTETPFSIDFSVGDIIVPSAVERTLPVILPDFEKPSLLTYPLESVISEKIDAIISLMETTGRMKDFYDIYYLATKYDFEGEKLRGAIYETLKRRGTPYDADSIKTISRLSQDTIMLKQWENFCKKTLKNRKENFNKLIELIIDFADPPFKSIVKGEAFSNKWSYKDKKYLS